MLTSNDIHTFAIIHNDDIPLLLNIKIAGKECFAIVDTGAQSTFIDNEFVEVNYLPIGKYEYMAVSGIGFRPDMQSNQCSTVLELRDNSLSNHSYKLQCYTMDLSELRCTFKEKGYDDVVLILGADWMKKVYAVIDVREHKLTIAAKEVDSE